MLYNEHFNYKTRWIYMYQIVSNSAIKLTMYTSEEPTGLAPASVSLTIANIRP